MSKQRVTSISLLLIVVIAIAGFVYWKTQLQQPAAPAGFPQPWCLPPR